LRTYYYALTGALGGLIAWYVLGRFGAFYSVVARDLWAGACVGGIIGALIGSLGGIWDRSALKTARGAAYSAGAGLIGGAVGLLIGEVVLWIFGGGVAGRAAGWLCLGLAVGVGEGMSRNSTRQITYGAVGGAVGGFIGGAAFETLRGSLGNELVSQALGMLILGGFIGGSIAAAEIVLRDAWLMVIAGDREGREFTLGSQEVTIGADGGCDIVLPRDGHLLGRHATIRRIGGGFRLAAMAGAEAASLVNNRPAISPLELHNKDRITIGGTKLLFRCKAR
jgi:Inner membrane component of T3SS, cytoplasmic domain